MSQTDFHGMCCFCGGTLEHSEAIELGFSAPEDRSAVQGVWSHAHCLAERLHPDISLLPDISDRVARKRGQK
jgi:hypothetical protein